MRSARPLALLAAACALPAIAGPVEIYLEGPRYCPRDVPKTARPIDGDAAIVRARPLLPDGFCGPSRAIDGCDADTEELGDTFRVYFHQYKLRNGRRDWAQLDHTYVILDAVGNCLAHIPGTKQFDRAW
jgi:hypothetical protein